MSFQSHRRVWLLLAVLAAASAPQAYAQAVDDDISDEYRATFFPFHKLTDKTTGFGYLGYVENPDRDYSITYVGYGLSYSASKSVQYWAGLVGLFTNNEFAADKREWRPFVGVKFFVPNEIHWNIYNYTRWELRSVENQDTGDRTTTNRLRSRFGVEIPLTSKDRAWSPHTWYGLFDIEPYYRFDRDQVDPFRWRAGIAFIANSRTRIELIYHAQYTRPNGGLEYTDNIYRLNVKFAMNRGMLQNVFDGSDSDD